MKKNIPVIFLTFANDKIDDALYLRNLPKELHGIRMALDKAAKEGLCEVVERTAATVDDIFNTFQDPYYQDRIAVFHYGGHASGSQLMLETLDGGHGYSYSDGLVPFLAKQKGLKLAFFNGCSSQEQAMDLSEAGIPAVIGTATAIKDDIATELSGRFYNGLASGMSINEAWLESLDIVKTKNSTKKQKGLKLRRDKGNDFPWRILYRDGSEIVMDWNLPSATNNPLFGLPKLPFMDLPEEPFLFLRRYEPKHAEIFFGRGRYIRQLYDRITSAKAAPVILFYGQSGAGKSSALASGLLPRLEQEADVKYLRRDPQIGLLGTLDSVLGGGFEEALVKKQERTAIFIDELKSRIEDLVVFAETIEDPEKAAEVYFTIKILNNQLAATDSPLHLQSGNSRLERWLSIEAKTGRPFHILLDQVEETYTRFNPDLENELEQLLQEIKNIFSNASHRPKGKIILSYRKEYNPEIEDLCKKLEIPREKIFLKKLEREDIIEVVQGIASTNRLFEKYKTSIDENLPAVIADNLLEDKDSPIAPVLSILLTKLWQLSQKEDYGEFSVLQYQDLRKEGILMEDFFHQQMEKIRVWRPKYEESGLALDVLNVHTTALGTADSRALEELRQRYEHQGEAINQLLGQFKDLYLLSDAGKDQTGLAHDTLAPIVIREARESDKSGQRALRILNGKVNDFVQDKTLLLDEADLSFVEAGKEGMRLWSEMERELVDLSIKKRTKNRKQRRIRQVLATTAVTFILVLGAVSVFSLIKQEVAQSEKGLTDLISLEHRVEDIQAIEGCPNDVLIDMKTIIDRFTSGSIISRVFIDNSPFEEFEVKFDTLENDDRNNCPKQKSNSKL
jgi:hypothetical protein